MNDEAELSPAARASSSWLATIVAVIIMLIVVPVVVILSAPIYLAAVTYHIIKDGLFRRDE